MKKEYIPGDLCIVKGKVESVCGVDRDNDFSITTDQHPFVQLSEVKPIRLTPEILEKNGWSKGQIYFRHSRIPRIKLCTDGGFWWSVSINDDIMGSYISYVHQLQHILFAFNIDEEMEV